MLMPLLRFLPVVENGWTWSDEDKAQWQPGPSLVQQFYAKWRGATLPEHTSLPYEIEVGLHEDGTPLLPFHAHATSESRILITKTYEDIFHRLLDLRRVDKSTGGAVITGQPGTGTFNGMTRSCICECRPQLTKT